MEVRLALDTARVTVEFDRRRRRSRADRAALSARAGSSTTSRRRARVDRGGSAAPAAGSIRVGRGTRVVTRPSPASRAGCRRTSSSRVSASHPRRRDRMHGCGLRQGEAPACLRPSPPSDIPSSSIRLRRRRLAAPQAAAAHEVGWQWLQAGDLKNAERSFSDVLKTAPGFYPSEAGLGYVGARAQGQRGGVVALRSRPRGRRRVRAGARRARRGAARARPARAGARQLRGGGRGRPEADGACARASTCCACAGCRTTWMRRGRRPRRAGWPRRRRSTSGRSRRRRTARFSIASLPSSNAETATWTRRSATRGRRRSSSPSEPRNFVAARRDLRGAGGLRRRRPTRIAPRTRSSRATRSRRSSTSSARRRHSPRCRKSTSSIETAPTVTRAQLAALLGVRLDDLLKRARRDKPVVMTDTRGNWAAPWILAVARAGIMEVYPNHTFQPNDAGPARRPGAGGVASAVAHRRRSARARRLRGQDARGRFPICRRGT